MKMMRPILEQYGLAGVDCDIVTSDYNRFVEAEKSKQKQKDLKTNLGFFLALFTWTCPLSMIILVIQILAKILFGYDTISFSDKTTWFFIVYSIFSIHCFLSDQIQHHPY